MVTSSQNGEAREPSKVTDAQTKTVYWLMKNLRDSQFFHGQLILGLGQADERA